jgi:hypothetical protein
MRRTGQHHKQNEKDNAYRQKARQLYLSEESGVPSRKPPFSHAFFELQKRLLHWHPTTYN